MCGQNWNYAQTAAIDLGVHGKDLAVPAHLHHNRGHRNVIRELAHFRFYRRMTTSSKVELQGNGTNALG